MTDESIAKEGSSRANEPDDEDTRACLADADLLKVEGNGHFRAQRWDEAIAAYRSALGRLPKRATNNFDARNRVVPEERITPESVEDILTPTELETQCANARAIINANIGACFLKLNDFKECVAACTQALLDNPEYVKALQRRAASNEKINTWGSLSSSQEDYRKLLALLPPSSTEAAEANLWIKRLEPRVADAQKEETAEMLGKLKGLGNSILGNFGLSTDNFKFEPNGSGGYGVNFSR